MEAGLVTLGGQEEVMAQPRAYCTYFDSGYLSRGLTLIDSLREHGDNSPVWVLALDDDTKKYLDELARPNLHTLTVANLEAAEPRLAPLRAERSRMEYYFTCTPQLTLFVMSKYPDPTPVVIYLDADMYFFDDPGLVLDSLGTGSVGIIEHRYPPGVAKRLQQYGRFNVGWVGFRADSKGRACLDWWAASCLEWCFDRPEDGKYADQGYLNSFPGFDGVVILQPTGLDLAPWNTARHHVTSPDGSRVVVDRDDPLVFFHFHGVRRVGNWYVTSQLVYGSRLTPVLRGLVYTPYLKRLEQSTRSVSEAIGNRAPAARRGNGWRGIVSRIRKSAIDRVTILTGNAIAVKDLGRD